MRVVVRIDLGAELDLLQAGAGLLLAGFLLLDVPFVLVLPVVHDPGHGRVGLRSDLDEVQIEILGLTERLAGLDDPDLLSVRAHQADLGDLILSLIRGSVETPHHLLDETSTGGDRAAPGA